ncbi:MAG: DUF6504 family protein [Dermatophilaceae bacterium]
MVRKFDDLVEVRSAEGSMGRPEAFIWRGRLYVVRTVLGQWRERRAWWREAFDAGAASEPAPRQVAMSHPVVGAAAMAAMTDLADLRSGTAPGEAPAAEEAGRALAAAAREQQVWRVEASPGWSFTSGVYDLAREPATDPAQADHWSLVRVAD